MENRNGKPLSPEEEQRLKDLLARPHREPQEAEEATQLANRLWGIYATKKRKETEST